jgi:dipeptidyl aminopeptidase/acylaminoacyl peptidase
MVIRASGKDAYEITVQNHDPASLALVCSGASSTLTGTGQLVGSTLVMASPEITCDDGSEPKVEMASHPPEEILRESGGLTFFHYPESDILTNYSPIERRGPGDNSEPIYDGLTLVWGRADAENRIGDVSGWVTYSDKRGIWARDLTSPDDPADRVLLSSTPGTLIGWSRDGSKLLVVRDVRDPGVPPACPPCGPASRLNETDLFVLNSDGTEIRLTDPNEWATGGGSFSPDGTAVVYAGSGAKGTDSPSTIYVVDAEGGASQVLLTTADSLVQEPKWSPDGSRIAYFDGRGDSGNSLRVMDSDGTDSRVVVESSETMGDGHIYGLEWSPDGSQLAFSIEGRLSVVGVDGSGLRLVTENGVAPYWSPDGSYIAYTLPDRQGTCGACVDLEHGTLDIVRLDDLEVQNFGDGGSGPWTAELRW